MFSECTLREKVWTLRVLLVITSANEVGEVLFLPLFVCLFVCVFVCLFVCVFAYLFACLFVCLFDCLSVCEQLPDHNFSCQVMKLSGSNCYFKIWK